MFCIEPAQTPCSIPRQSAADFFGCLLRAIAVRKTTRMATGVHEPLPALVEELRVLLDSGRAAGCMFCIEPAQTPCSIPRQSPKYFHVRESGPRGTGCCCRQVDYACCQIRIDNSGSQGSNTGCIEDQVSAKWGSCEHRRTQGHSKGDVFDVGVTLLGAVDGPAVNVRAVLQAAGLTERYFYESFTDRDQYVVAVHTFVAERAQSALASAVESETTSEAVATAAVDAFVKLMVDDPAMGRVLLIAPLSEPV